MADIYVCSHGNTDNCQACHDLYTSKIHGVKSAYYSNLPGPEQTAIIECLCGEEFTGQTPSWEDAGREVDLHLERAKRGQL